MKRTKCSHALLLSLLGAALFCAACWSSPEQTVEEFFQEVTVAYASMDGQTVADLWHYPIITEMKGEQSTTERAELLAYFQHLFYGLSEKAALSELDLRIVEPKEGAIDITIEEEIATISNACLYLGFRTADGVEETMQELEPFRLIRVGKKWKFLDLAII